MEVRNSKISEMSLPEYPNDAHFLTRTAIASLVENNKSAVCQRHFSNMFEFGAHLKEPQERKEHGTKLYMLPTSGAGVEYLRVFASHARVEGDVIESHLLRSRCRLSRGRRESRALDRGREARTFALDYPHFVGKAVDIEGEKTQVDENDARRRALRINEDIKTVFCRVTLSVSEGEHGGEIILILFDEPTEQSRRPFRSQIEDRRGAQLLQSFGTTIEHATSLRDHVLCATTAEKESNFNMLRDVLSEFCLTRWTDLLDEFPTSGTTVCTSENIIKMKDMLRSNLRNEKLCFISQCQPRTTHLPLEDEMRLEDWSDLLQSLEQRLPITDSLSPGTLISAETEIKTQRSINRITYLGAILLPFSIVAAILTLDGEFAPGKSLFWVYWVVGVPISGLVVLLIYADGIRRLTFGEWQRQEIVVENESDSVGNDFVPDLERLLRMRRERLIRISERARDMEKEVGWGNAFASICKVDVAKRMMAKRQPAAGKKLSTDV